MVVLAFLEDFFGEGGLPVINFGSSCGGPVFPETDLLQCPQIGYAKFCTFLTSTCRLDIETCQASGKTILLSLGGAYGNYSFSSASQAASFASTLWNVFGGGNSTTRPFGSAIVDGFDLDIENNEPQYYSDFISALRQYYATGNKPYYITGAPQLTPIKCFVLIVIRCIFPDASLGPALDSSLFE